MFDDADNIILVPAIIECLSYVSDLKESNKSDPGETKCDS